MRYPLFAFLVLFILPPVTLHAALSGRAGFEQQSATADTSGPIAHRLSPLLSPPNAPRRS